LKNKQTKNQIAWTLKVEMEPQRKKNKIMLFHYLSDPWSRTDGSFGHESSGFSRAALRPIERLRCSGHPVGW
jgi:hypothetical protein